MWEKIIELLGGKTLDLAIKFLANKFKRSGKAASLVDELKRNATICRLVVKCDGDPIQRGRKLSLATYRQLRDGGYPFDKVKKGPIPNYTTMQGTSVEFLAGKTLADALGNISDRILEIQVICETEDQPNHTDLKRRFQNLAQRLAVVIRFASE